MITKEKAVESILDDLRELAAKHDTVTVDDIVQAIGYRGYGPFLLLPALLEVSPLGAIPVVPTVLATIVFIFAAQIALGRKHLWLPKALECREIPADRMTDAAEALDGLAGWLDRWFHERLKKLSGATATRIAAVCVMVLCLTVPPLELIPMATTAPMAAIAVFGLAMTVRDGALMLAGYILTILAFWAGYALGT